MNHLVRTSHHDTSTYDTYCGETRNITDPTPGADVCTNCIVAALESTNAQTHENFTRLADTIRKGAGDDFRKILGWVDDITLRLERLELRERRTRKGGKR